MKLIFGCLLFLFIAPAVSAYELLVTEVSEPYAVVPIASDEFNKQIHLGALNNFPVMYEISVDKKTDLTVQVSEVAHGNDPTGFSLMLVRQNDDDGGVTEVARQIATDNDWSLRKDSVYGLTFLEGEALTQELESGVYRIEVSTPVNQGKFMLTVGREANHLGYFSTLSRVRAIQGHFGYSVFKMLTSSYIYYPLGIFILSWVFYRTWKYRTKIQHVA